ncbi:hypothetical protein C0991_003079 [Blastosporella zonata]|nr:hypothetical protein C0991_003079 [Blastosporella zonata]
MTIGKWQKLLQNMFTATICIMGSRLVLNLREAYYRYTPSETDTISQSDEATRFERSEPSQNLTQEEGDVPLQDFPVRGDLPARPPSQWSEVPRPLTALDKIISIA